MKFVSWNVNGLRACMGKGFMDRFRELDADFFCLQETKLQAGQITMDLPGYYQYWCYAEKKGYSGTAIFTRHEPRSVRYGLGIEELDTEGRVITLEYDEFFLVTCYTPNAQRGLARIDHRLKWEEAFRQFLTGLDAQKPVILCGDLNVAHKEIDLKNPASNRGNAGFSDEERNAFTALLDSGFTDSFRHLYPDKTGAYSWWSYMFNARQNNAGWRIDYFVVSNRLCDAIHDATIHPDVLGSDHCPVGLELNTLINGGIPFPSSESQEVAIHKEADGDNSVSLRHFILTGTCFLVLAVLLCLGLTIPKKPSPQKSDPNMVDIPKAEGFPLIADIIDRTGNLTYSMDYAGPLSSSFPGEYFICGEERFALDYVMYPNTVLMQNPPPNYYVQIQFPSTGYPIESTPEVISAVTHYSSNPAHYRKVRYYYDENGNIGGCFLYGYSTHNIQLKITVRNGEASCNREISVIPDFDFGSMTTQQLVELINDSYIVQASCFLSTAQALDSLIESEATLQELIKREDAIRVLLDNYSPGLDVSNLLFTEQFQKLMTEEDQQILEVLQNRDDDEALYGEIIAGWADEPAM